MAAEYISHLEYSTSWGGSESEDSPDCTSGQWAVTIHCWHDGRDDRGTPTYGGETMTIIETTGGGGGAHSGGCKICYIPITPALIGVQAVAWTSGYQDIMWVLQVNGATAVESSSHKEGSGTSGIENSFTDLLGSQMALSGMQSNQPVIAPSGTNEGTVIGEKQHAYGSMSAMYTDLTYDSAHIHGWSWAGNEDCCITWCTLSGALPNTQIIIAE